MNNNNNKPDLSSFRLKVTRDVERIDIPNVGSARVIDKENFPALNGVTCYNVEVWEECMRLPHWHPNAAELGYLLSGSIEVIIWRAPGETAMFTLSAGMCWFIPQGALHSLNNISSEKAMLLVGFSNDNPTHMDLPVAFNGIPVPLRDAYTSPHEDLRKWQGVTENPLLGRCPVLPGINNVRTGSPYGFDFAKVTPLFDRKEVGSVTWGIKDNWPILDNISILRARLKPGVARDAIWYPDVGTLYAVSHGKGEFHIISAHYDPKPLAVELFDYIFVPIGVLHTFINTSEEDFEVIAFFTNANPAPEVSLTVATGFFPNNVRKAAMTMYGTENKKGDPLKNLNYTSVSPYLIKLAQK